MQHSDLNDLVLSGIQWEITELPMATINAAIAQKKRDAATAAAAPVNAPAPTMSPADMADISPNLTRTVTSIVPPSRPVVPMSVDTAVAMASRPGDMDALSRMIAEFNHPLRGGATNVVLPHIAPNPNGLVIITDIPGADDDASGRILSGAAGELLDKMIGAIGMSRDNVSILPLVFWRTPGGRTPTREELDLSRPFVDRCVEMLAPRMILTLGTLPGTEIANVTLPRGHGAVTTLASGVQCVPIFHPNFLILKPASKRDAWDALQNIQKLLKNDEK